MNTYLNRLQNLLLKKLTYINNFPSEEKVVYLTFDDGPEEGITDFVLGELDKYGFKATFFCRGDNAEKYPELMAMLLNQGHSIGNHTYSHTHSYNNSSKEYAANVEKADKLLDTKLFRPPHGSLTLSAWLRLHKKYRVFFWSLNSGDSDNENFNYQRSMDNLKTKTKSGDIVLFHFCHRHEKETRKLLPEYLKWLHEQGFESKAIE